MRKSEIEFEMEIERSSSVYFPFPSFLSLLLPTAGSRKERKVKTEKKNRFPEINFSNS